MNSLFTLAALIILSSSSCYAKDFHLIELDELKIDYIQFLPGGRDPLITGNGLPDRQLGQLLDLNIDSTLLKYGYFNSLVHSMTDSVASTNTNGQFRSVGLRMELGVRIAPCLDVYAYHYSQHLLDTSSSTISGFPEADGIGIHIYLYSNKRKDSLVPLK